MDRTHASFVIAALLHDAIEDCETPAEEIAQLIYHTQLLMIAANVSIEDVYRHL